MIVEIQEETTHLLPNLLFSYPPKTNQATLADGFASNEAFYKKDMTSTLTEKVRRNNNIVVETQGAIIITSQ